MSAEPTAGMPRNHPRQASDAPVTTDQVITDAPGISEPSELRLIRHGRCGKTWTGITRGHCGACHETFTAGAFDMHQRISHGVITCSTAKLHARNEPWGTLWSSTPVGEGAARWAAIKSAATATGDDQE